MCKSQGKFVLTSDKVTFEIFRFPESLYEPGTYSHRFLVSAECHCGCVYLPDPWIFVCNPPYAWNDEDVKMQAERLKMKYETFKEWCNKLYKKMKELCPKTESL